MLFQLKLMLNCFVDGSGVLDDTQLSVLEEGLEASMTLMHVYEKSGKIEELADELRCTGTLAREFGSETNNCLRRRL